MQVRPRKIAKFIAIFDIPWLSNIEYSDKVAVIRQYIAIFDIRRSSSPVSSNLW